MKKNWMHRLFQESGYGSDIIVMTVTQSSVQAYLQRVLGMDYLTTQGFMKLWYIVVWVGAWGFALGVSVYVVDFFAIGRLKKEDENENNPGSH